MDEPIRIVAITLQFRKFDIDPSDVSRALGIEPTQVRRTGEYTQLPNGNVLKLKSTYNAWGYTEDHYGVANFGDLLASLVARLVPATDFVADFTKRCELSSLILRLPGDIHSGSDVEPQTLSIIATLNLKFGVEVFPKWNR